MEKILFYAFSAKMLSFAVMSLVFKNNVNRALSLVLSFFAAAILAIMINAEFIATMLIVIYMGAIAMLFLFVIITIGDGNDQTTSKNKTLCFKKISTILCVIFAAIFIFVLMSHIYSSNARFETSERSLFSTKDIGIFLYNIQYSTIIYCGLILFIALVSAVVIAVEYKFQSKNDDFDKIKNKINISNKARLVKKDIKQGEVIL
jgi:NADH-quinone oxidoreductase subunit J